MIPVLEAVPNLSSGRDPDLVLRAIGAIEAEGVDVFDASSDPDHNRSVLTFAGAPDRVEGAAVALARVALEGIDLNEHRGVHPRVGALDVLPFVPLQGLTMADARRVAHRVGRRIAHEVGIPVWFYAEASEPPGRRLSELRRGGFEALLSSIPPGREPDVLPPGESLPSVHATAGGVCVGARPPLLAWNVDVTGLRMPVLRGLAAELREAGGGIPGLRVLALELPRQRRMQLSMNLEDAARRDPFGVFRTIEARVEALGGRVVRTEVIGLPPDELLAAAAADRLRVLDRTPPLALSSLLAGHLSRRAAIAVRRAIDALRAPGGASTEAAVRILDALERELLNPPYREPKE
jgi:glutamate formiminotransferase